MLLFLSVLACGDKANDTSVTETASEAEPSAEVIPFAPNEGHWTYSGGELVSSGTTCQLDSATQGDLTDPVGFNLSLSEQGFVIQSDEAGDSGTNCVMTDPESPEAGSYICANASTSVLFESVWSDGSNDMDVTMTIDTAVVGGFIDASTLANTFTLTLACTDVDYILPLGCSDISSQFPTPCTIQFTANATLDAQ